MGFTEYSLALVAKQSFKMLITKYALVHQGCAKVGRTLNDRENVATI